MTRCDRFLNRSKAHVGVLHSEARSMPVMQLVSLKLSTL